MRKFISNCKAQQPPPGNPPPVNPPAGMQQPFGKKSNKGLLIAIIAIVIVVVVVVLAVVLLMGGSDSRFVGEWESMGFTYNFKSDGTLEVMGIEMATWSVSGDQICFEYSIGGEWAELVGEEAPQGKQCEDYEFSDGGNTLTIGGIEFTKK